MRGWKSAQRGDVGNLPLVKIQRNFTSTQHGPRILSCLLLKRLGVQYMYIFHGTFSGGKYAMLHHTESPSIASNSRNVTSVLLSGSGRGVCKSISRQKATGHSNHSCPRLSHAANVSIESCLLLYLRGR